MKLFLLTIICILMNNILIGLSLDPNILLDTSESRFGRMFVKKYLNSYHPHESSEFSYFVPRYNSFDQNRNNQNLKACSCKLNKYLSDSNEFDIDYNLKSKFNFQCICKNNFNSKPIKIYKNKPLFKNYHSLFHNKPDIVKVVKRKRRKKNQFQNLVLNEPINHLEENIYSDDNHLNSFNCKCNSNGCQGSNCFKLNGCVCNNNDFCWGNSCNLKSAVKFQTNPDDFNSMESSSYINSLKNLFDTANYPAENIYDKVKYLNKHKSKISNSNQVLASSLNYLIKNSLGNQNDYSLVDDYVEKSFNPNSIKNKNNQIADLNKLSLAELILDEMKSSNLKEFDDGFCNCEINKCFGFECRNLNGCVCDQFNCYGKYCSIFTNLNSFNHENTENEQEIPKSESQLINKKQKQFIKNENQYGETLEEKNIDEEFKIKNHENDLLKVNQIEVSNNQISTSENKFCNDCNNFTTKNEIENLNQTNLLVDLDQNHNLKSNNTNNPVMKTYEIKIINIKPLNKKDQNEEKTKKIHVISLPSKTTNSKQVDLFGSDKAKSLENIIVIND